jgi:hypothetical protein
MACEPNQKSPIATAPKSSVQGGSHQFARLNGEGQIHLNFGATLLQADAPDAAKRPHTVRMVGEG